MKRILAMLLCMVMLLTSVPVQALATEAEEPVVLAPQEQEAPVEATEAPVEVVEETTEATEEATEPVEETTEPVEETTAPAEEPAQEEAAQPEETEPQEEAAAKSVQFSPRTLQKAFWKMLTKTKTKERTVRYYKDLGNGRYTYEDKVITDTFTYTIPVRETSEITVKEWTEEEGTYFFTTFQDLQELIPVVENLDYAYLCYIGADPLVIEEDFYLPDAVNLDMACSESSHLIIPAGVTVTNDGTINTNRLEIAGRLNNSDWISVTQALTVTGTLETAGYITLGHECVLTGEDNLVFVDYGNVEQQLVCHGETEFMDALSRAQAKLDNEAWNYYIHFYCYEDLVLSESMTLPRNCYVDLSSVEEIITVTVPQGLTLTIDGYQLHSYAHLVVDGDLVVEKDSLLTIPASTGATLTVTDKGSYSGYGNLMVTCYEDIVPYEEVLKGLDFADFLIEEVEEGWILQYIVGRSVLAAPTDLTWHKETAWDMESQREILVDRKGSLVFKPAEPHEKFFEISLYYEGENGYELVNNCGYSWEDTPPEWISTDLFFNSNPQTGNYYFEVSAAPQYQSDSVHSPVVCSEVYHYVKPDKRMAAPTNLTIEQVINDFDEEILQVTWDSEAPARFEEYWYFSRTPQENPEENYDYYTNFYCNYPSNSTAVYEWLLQEWGDGYYYCKIRLVPENIEETYFSDWSEVVGYHYYDVVGNVRSALWEALETSSSPKAARAAAQAIDMDELLLALEKDREDSILPLYTDLEKVAGGAAAVKLTDGFSGFAAKKVSVVGANLNSPAASGTAITLNLGKPAASHPLSGDLNNSHAVPFSLKLGNVDTQQALILVTLPVPDGFTAAETVLVYHGPNGDEVLTPLRKTADSVTVAVKKPGDYTLTADTFTQDEFLADFNKAVETGRYRYELEKPVVLDKDIVLDGKDSYISLLIPEGSSMTLSEGAALTLHNVSLGVDGGEFTVKGKLNARNGSVEVATGVITIADTATVDAYSLYLHLDKGGKLVGWPLDKTTGFAACSDEATLRSYLALADKYLGLGLYVVPETHITLEKDLYIPNNVSVELYEDTSLTVPSGVTLDLRGGMYIYYACTLNVKAGATLRNIGALVINANMNMEGNYDGLGQLRLEPGAVVNGTLIHLTYSNPNDEDLVVTAHLYPDDPAAKYVWKILDGEEYANMEVNGDTVTISDKIDVTEKHEVKFQVSTKDGSVVNHFSAWILPDEDLDGHTHEYKEIERVEPTYTQPGYILYQCDCGQTKTEELAPLGLPAPVLTVTNEVETGKPILSWTYDGEAEAYEIYRATSKNGTYKLLDTMLVVNRNSTYVDATAASGKTYYYKAKAVWFPDSTLNSKLSAYKSAKCLYPQPVAYGACSGEGPVITWEKVEGAKKYDVYYATSILDTFKKLATTSSTTYTHTKATTGTLYYYKVRAYGSSVDYAGALSESCFGIKTLATPSVTVTADNDRGAATISWKKVTGTQNYLVQCSVNGGEFADLISLTDTKFIHEGLSVGNSYTYRVQAQTEMTEAWSQWSEEKTVIIRCGVPVVESSNDAFGKPVLNWAPTAGADSYEVHVATSSKGTYTLLTSLKETTYIHEAAEGAKTYYYKVCAVDVNGNPSDFSKVVSVACICQTPVIQSISNNASGDPVLQWNEISGAKKYEVYRAASADSKFSKVATTSALTFADSKASVGKTYFYKVKAVASKSAYNSEFSDVLSCNSLCAQPSFKLALTTATGQPSISWSKVTGASQYEILRATAADGVYESLAVQTALSFKDTTAAVDTEYFYKVNAIASDAVYNSLDAEPKSIRSTCGQPVISTVSDAVTGKPVISWAAVDGAANYEVARATKSKGTYTPVATVAELTFTDDTAAGGKTYYYKVTAITASGVESAASSYKSAKCICATPVITVQIDAASGKPSISWEKVSGAKKYEVYRATSETSKYSKVATSTKLSYTDTKASVGKTYFYKVKAVASSSAYNSAFSEIKSCLTILAQPKVTLNLNATTGQPKLSWKKISGAAGYEIYRSVNDGAFQLISSQTAVSYADTDTVVDGKYSYKVLAIHADPALNSAEGEGLSVYAACAKPVIKATLKENKPLITWEAVEGAKAYNVYRSTKSGKGYTLLGTVTESEYHDLTAAKGKTYYYKVEAVSENAVSALSSYAKIKSK